MPDTVADARIWLRTQRASHDQTQEEAAEAVGVSRHTFARWEGSTLRPTLEQAVALARWADVTVDVVATAFGLVELQPVELDGAPAAQ
jgi:DNA-binding XRE family transcriptional regulator